MHSKIRWITLTCAAGILGTAHAQPAPERSSGFFTKTDVYAKHAMVAAAHPLAVDAGVAVLKRGGSAVDAAIAVQLVLNVVEPQSSGVGGGAFMLVHSAPQATLVAYDGRETAPRAAKEDRFIGADGKPIPFYDAVVGGQSVGTPGTVKLLAHTHAKHGKLPWAELFTPAITLAEQGFTITPRLHMAIRTDRFLKNDANARALFFDANGEAKAIGSTLRNPALAATLRTLASQGAPAFYQGDLTDAMIAAANGHKNAGDLSREDFARYTVIERAPICSGYRGYRVCGMPAPSSGGVAIAQMLGLLERFDLARLPPNGLIATHLIAEAGRLAYADRNRYLADPAFSMIPAGLTDPGYLAQRSGLIDVYRSLKRAEPGNPPAIPAAQKNAAADDQSPEFNATSHLSVIDAQGNAVSMTTTIEDTMGSRIMVGGFLLNNELTDFSALAQEDGRIVANRIEPGKRPRSTMSPTIIYDAKGKLFMVTGSPGGSAIVNYVAKSIIGVIDWKLSPQAAAQLPHSGSRNGPTEIEKGTSAEALIDGLNLLGHETRVIEFTSGIHTIVRSPRGWVAGADPRREGTAKGL